MKTLIAIFSLLLITECLGQIETPKKYWNSEESMIADVKKTVSNHDYASLKAYEIPNNFPPELDGEPACFSFTNFTIAVMPADYLPRPKDHETANFKIIAQPGEIKWIRIIDADDPDFESAIPILVRDGKYYIYQPMYEKK